MENSVQELIDMLYSMITEAWGLPLGAERCVIERDKALDLLDEIKAKLPGELTEAKRLVSARAEFIANAKREAESMKKVAEDRARQLVEEQEVVRAANERAKTIVSTAEQRAAELRNVANQYADDTLQRTEEAISAALGEVRNSRSRFRSVSGTGTQSPMSSIVPDLD